MMTRYTERLMTTTALTVGVPVHATRFMWKQMSPHGDNIRLANMWEQVQARIIENQKG